MKLFGNVTFLIILKDRCYDHEFVISSSLQLPCQQ